MKGSRSILIVEDEDVIRSSLKEFLTDEGYEVSAAGTVAQALSLARAKDFLVAICDVQLPDGDGIDLLRRLQQLNPGATGLVITAYATVENAVEAFKSGAFDYLVKPVIFDDLANKLNRLFQYRDLYLENQSLRRELARREPDEDLVGTSKAMKEVREMLSKVAKSQSHVLLMGESGVGKQLCARAIHRWSPRKQERWVAVHCGTQPVELLDSQLFGAAAGQASGANEGPGLFVEVGEGTVFLDEVAELPLNLQAKLLRAIEHHEVTPLGGTNALPIRARIVAATTQDLARLSEEGKFNVELSFRLSGLQIRIPPLRERLDDVPELVDAFIARHSAAMGRRITSATSETIRLLVAAPWNGNVRQLDNAIERAVMMCNGNLLEPKDLPAEVLGVTKPLPDTDDLRSALRHYERLHIERVLREFPDKREAAKRLRLGLSSLYRKIEELGIDL